MSLAFILQVQNSSGQRRQNVIITIWKRYLIFLSEYPQVARVREELTPSVRVHPFGSHIVMYIVDETGDVFIIRIRHAHEDWLTH